MAVKRKTTSKKLKAALEAREEAAVSENQAAPPRPLEGSDPNDLINDTSTSEDELNTLNSRSLSATAAHAYKAVDLALLEERIGISARIILESALRIAAKDNGLSLKDKADIALRAITTLEGSKQEVLWRDKRLKKPAHMGLSALKKEREKAAERLHKVAMRKKEVQIAKAEEALNELNKLADARERGEN